MVNVYIYIYIYIYRYQTIYPDPINSENPEIRLFLKIVHCVCAGTAVVQYRYSIPLLVFSES